MWGGTGNRREGKMIGALVAKKALGRAFGALNRHDLKTFMAAWREDGVFVYPGNIPESGIFQGKDAVQGWFARFFEQFPKIRFEVQDVCVRDMFDLTGTNVAAVHWALELTNRRGRVGHNSGVTVIRLERGKVVHVKDFIFDTGEAFRLNWGDQ
jgi:ketosteroid isomerase-like protein